MKYIISLLLFYCISIGVTHAQCPTGSEPPCRCSTAEVLCSVDELDGFSGFLEPYQHPQDGPSPFCGSSTITQNPTWFAFIAWCDNIEMEVDFDNCTTQPNGYGGAQLAVYTDCTFNDQVDCNETCVGASGTVTVDMNGLTIGESYYVMLDGCGGSICDYEISVSPRNCNEEIEDWDDDLTEELVVCIGDIESYRAERVTGATNWHWFIDGDEVDITDDPNYEIEWDTEGTFELCVDASNICVDVDDDPEPNCVDIFVGAPDAGEIEADDNPLCPEEFSDVEVSNYNSSPGYEQYLIIVDSDGEVIMVVAGDQLEVTWPNCTELVAYSWNFPEGEDVDVPDVGDDYKANDCLSECCDESELPILFQDDEEPEFDDAPDDLAVACVLELESLGLEEIEELDVDDNCTEVRDVLGVETIMIDTCLGGTIIREWEFVDSCGNRAYHIQTITIGPLNQVQFLSEPRDTTMTNLEYDRYMIDSLAYGNMQVGACGISGKVPPKIVETRVGCLGMIDVTWTFEDPCGNTLTTDQVITLEADVTARDTILNYCDDASTGIVEIDKIEIDILIAPDVSGYVIGYYSSEADRNSMTNFLNFPISSELLPSSVIFASVTDPSGCTVELNVEINVSPLPELEAIGIAETCKDIDDGIILLQSSSPASLPYIILQGIDTVRTDMLLGKAPGSYDFTIIDSLGCEGGDVAVIQEGAELELVAMLMPCNNNMSGTDVTDDSYEVEFVGSGATGVYDVMINGVSTNSSIAYDETASLSIPATGDPTLMTLVDLNTGCEAEADIGILETCSDDCELIVNLMEEECKDAGTEIDPADDFFEMMINLSVINGGASNSYDILLNGMVIQTFDYDVLSTFTLPADMSTVTLKLRDSDRLDCTIEWTLPTLTPCSNTCRLEINNIVATCTDPMTPADSADDLYSVEFLVTGVNASSSFEVLNDGSTWDYGQTVTIGDFLISDGSITIEIVDSDDPLCIQSEIVAPPDPCSTPCDVTIITLEMLDCDDNMTGMVLDDDFFFINLNVASQLGTGTEYSLSDADGNVYGPFLYNEENNLGPFTATGELITLQLSDADNSVCELEINFSQVPCSACDHTLGLEATVLTLDCINNMSELTATGNTVIKTYEWSGPNNFSSQMESITISESGTYSLLAIFEDGCELSEMITIGAAQDLPVSDAGNDRLLNCEVSSVTITGEGSQYGNNVVFNWYDENGDLISTDIEIEVTEPGIYSLQLVDTLNLCESQLDEVVISENMSEPVAVIYADPGDILNCTISDISLTYETEENTSYVWVVDNQEVTDRELVITAEESIMLIAIDTLSECSADTSLLITDLTDFPIIDLNVEGINCVTNESCVTFAVLSPGDLVYSWYDESGQLISNQPEGFCFSEAGTYSVELVDMNSGCEKRDTFMIAEPDAIQIELETLITLERDEQVVLMPEINYPEEDLEFILWEGDAELSCYDCLNPEVIFAEDSTILSLTVRTLEGCEAKASIEIDIIRIPRIYIPNIIAPDQGELLTVFSNLEISQVDGISIYDRWGNLQYANESFPTNDVSFGWDGTKNGQVLEQGVYIYYLRYTFEGRQEIKVGTVTVMR